MLWFTIEQFVSGEEDAHGSVNDFQDGCLRT